jgi:putative chitinase
MITGDILRAVLLGFADAEEDAPLLDAACNEFEINTPLRQAAFIAQTAHESGGYKAFAENLNYRAAVLTRLWPHRFPASIAESYAHNPEKIANRAYELRMGNGDEASGDGWRYRGRGAIQATGKDNYAAMSAALGLDLVGNPDLLAEPAIAFRSAAWWWKSHNLNALADSESFRHITRVINGGLEGEADRLLLYTRAKKALGV